MQKGTISFEKQQREAFALENMLCIHSERAKLYARNLVGINKTRYHEPEKN